VPFPRTRASTARLPPDQDRAGDLVVEAALVRVPDQRGNGHAEQHRSHDRPPETGAFAGDRDQPQAEQPVADAAAERGQLHGLQEDEDPQNHETVVVQEGVSPDQAGQADGDGPVDHERREAPAHPPHRVRSDPGQAEALPRPGTGRQLPEGGGSRRRRIHPISLPSAPLCNMEET